ncbi:MAG: pyridoxal-phosphate dependent enzyme [Deltaproteobacteria bacterium]|nr:pyridoxal-phosphate dependent enzyme [Deltaproteobacteria bacterium]
MPPPSAIPRSPLPVAGYSLPPDTLQPIDGDDSGRPLYGPIFLEELRRHLAGHAHAKPDWSTNRLIVNVEVEAFPEKPPFTVYVLDSENRFKVENFTGPPESLQDQIRKKFGVHAEFVENPITYRLRLTGDPDALREQQVLLFRTAEALPSVPLTLREYHGLASYRLGELSPLDQLQWPIEETYLRSRFGQTDLGDPDLTYSPRAAMQAWQRVRETVPFSPIVPAPDLALAVGAGMMLLIDDSELPGGSFKIRGAKNRFEVEVELRMQTTGKSREEVIENLATVGFSHGNHGMAVAMVGGENALLVLPLDPQTQKIKIRNCLSQGSMVMLHGKKLRFAEKRANEIAEQGLKPFLKGLVYLPGNATDEEIDLAVACGKDVLLYGHPDAETTLDAVRTKAAGFPDSPLLIETYDDVSVSQGQGTAASELLAR